MQGFIAKKLCPDLIFVPINGDRYAENSQKVMDVKFSEFILEAFTLTFSRPRSFGGMIQT
jgi:hypothetical protein